MPIPVPKADHLKDLFSLKGKVVVVRPFHLPYAILLVAIDISIPQAQLDVPNLHFLRLPAHPVPGAWASKPHAAAQKWVPTSQ